MQIQEILLDVNPQSRPKKSLNKITKIVIHWVANPNSSAAANRNYFNNLKNQKTIYASAHYVIGLKGEVIRCIPENEVAYHAKQANSYSIGIECCHPDWEGKFNKDTYNSLIELCSMLCKKYNLNPTVDIIRHYDITKKDCPKFYVKNTDKWNKLKTDVEEKMKEEKQNVIKKKIKINNKIFECEVIEKNSNNFIKIQDLKQSNNIEIEYDNINKIPVIKIKL